jgi:hypothetical protein
MGRPEEWTFVDLYVYEPHIKNWDAKTLDEVPDGSVSQIYSSHLLEHFSHREIEDILHVWKDKLEDGGKIILNVPDLAWAAHQVITYENGQPLDGYFHEFGGEHGLLSVVYGSHSHEGEHHEGGFVKTYLEELLSKVGFKDVSVEKIYEAHQMGCLIARAQK